MFSILGNLYSKFVSVIISIMVAVGIISAPPPTPAIPVVTITPDVVIDTSNELADVSEQITNLKADLESEKQKRQKLEKTIASQPKEAQSNIQNISPQSTPGIKTFALPNGSIVDEFGNIISVPEFKKEAQIESRKFTVTEITNKIMPTITRIKTFTTDSQGLGSGIIVESDGLILTAAHVVRGFDAVEVNLSNGEKHTGKVIGRDEFNDIALLRINRNNLPIVEFGNSDNVMIGDNVLVFGHPLGFYLPSAVLSTGIIGGKQPGDNFVFLQTDAKTQPGSSGGAWVNEQGKLIGLHVSGIGPHIQGIKIDVGLNFAVPSNFVKNILPKLKQGENKIDYTSEPPPPKNSTIQIRQQVIAAIGLNPIISCENLGFTEKDLYVCILYKNDKNSYKWDIVTAYTNVTQKPDTILSKPAPPIGSAVKISNRITIAVLNNPDITCSQLSFYGDDLDTCRLYKNNKNSYIWEVVSD